jgi:hypothetical protein
VTPDDVVWTYSGVRPLYDDGAKSATAATRDYVLTLGQSAGPPLLNVFGGKITTYRRLAEAALAKLAPFFPAATGRLDGRRAAARRGFPRGRLRRRWWRALGTEAYPFLTEGWALRLVRAYGTEARAILGGAARPMDLGRDFGATLTEAEVRWLMDREWARTAEDVVWRRTKLGLRLTADQIARSTPSWRARGLPRRRSSLLDATPDRVGSARGGRPHDTHPGHRSGHHLDTSHRLRRSDDPHRHDRAGGVSAAYTPPRAGSSMTRICGHLRPPRGRRSNARGAQGAGHRGHRHHQPARDHPPLGPRDRPRRSQRHRLAGPPHRRLDAPSCATTATSRWCAQKTGLMLDPYFSATKLAWLLDNVDGARDRAEAGELAFGTVDSWLIWKLTGGGGTSPTPPTPARTMLYNIRKGRLGRRYPEASRHPRDAARGARLRRGFRHLTRPSSSARDPDPRRRRRSAGRDLGQACFDPGMLKSTYGTGCFRAAQHRRDAGRPANRLLDHHRLPARRQADLCARRLDLHRRRGGAMAARRAPRSSARRRARNPALAETADPSQDGLPRARLHRPRRALLGP